ncbi:hypothetical protein ACFLSA_01705 [Bacteroidota bacterium]
MKIKLAFLLISMFILPAFGSINLIGYHKNDIKDIMKSQKTGFYFNKELDNGRVRFIKYVDNYGDKTLIYVLNQADTCYYFLVMYDYSLLEEVVEQLNKTCTKEEEYIWSESLDNENYTIKLKKNEWYFTVVTRRKNP